MECPYCNAELINVDYYGTGNILRKNEFVKIGYIYRCPNSEYFESKEEADKYIEMIGKHLDQKWEEVCCDSSMNSVSGYFYTDSNENLEEGSPC